MRARRLVESGALAATMPDRALRDGSPRQCLSLDQGWRFHLGDIEVPGRASTTRPTTIPRPARRRARRTLTMTTATGRGGVFCRRRPRLDRRRAARDGRRQAGSARHGGSPRADAALHPARHRHGGHRDHRRVSPALRRIGAHDSPLIVIDEFSGDAGAIVAAAADLGPFGRAQSSYYPGLRRVIGAAEGAASDCNARIDRDSGNRRTEPQQCAQQEARAQACSVRIQRPNVCSSAWTLSPSVRSSVHSAAPRSRAAPGVMPKAARKLRLKVASLANPQP